MSWDQKYQLTKKKIWLTFLFQGLFLSDILYGGMVYYGIDTSVSPGELIRGSALIFALVMVLRNYRLINSKISFLFQCIYLLGLPSILAGAYVDGDLITDVFYLLRVFYGLVMISLFIILIKKYRIHQDDIFRYIEYSAYLVGISLFITQFSGVIRTETYGYYAAGSTGIFYAQNDLTLTLGLALLAASYRLIYFFSPKRLLLTGISMFACVNIGTRGSLGVVLGCAIVCLILVIHGRVRGNNIHQRLKLTTFSIFIAVGFFMIFYYGLMLQKETTYQIKKLEYIAQGNLPRSVLIQAAESHLDTRHQILNITGEGMTSFMWGVGRYFHGATDAGKRVEVDYIDYYGAYGIVFTLGIYILYIGMALAAGKFFLLDRIPQQGLIAASLILYIAHSLLAGHALSSPIPTTLMAGYAGVFLSSTKYKLL